MATLEKHTAGSRLAIVLTTVIVTTIVLVGGVALATVGLNSVGSPEIKNGSIQSIDIGNGQVRAADIGTGQVKSADIGTGQVASIDIGTGQVRSADIGTGQVKSVDIADGTITNDDVAPGAITSTDDNTLFVGSDNDADQADSAVSLGADGVTRARVGGPHGSLFTDEAELTLVETASGAAEYTQLVFENPATTIDWSWNVSSATGNLFLTSPALGADAITFEVTGALDTLTKVDALDTLDDVGVGGELEIDDLTVAGLSTDVCIDAAGASKLGRCASSNRYKEHVADLELGLDTVLALRPVTFDWIADGTADLGFVAEEVAAVAPLLATYDEAGTVEGVRYRQMTAVLANAVQDLNETVERQEAEIAELRALLEASP